MMNDFAHELFGTLLTLAQTTAPAGTPGSPELPWFARLLRDGGIMIPAILFFFVFYFIVIRGKKKQEAEKKKELESVKKGDKIETIGGLLGTVVNTTENTIVLKVDENTNTKMEFNRRAIHRVVRAEAKAEKK